MITVEKLKITELYVGDAPTVRIDGALQLDIGKIFDCGQCFRFDEVENSLHEKEFSGVAYQRFVSFAQDGNVLYIYGSTLEDYELIWKRYLNIERDYSLIDADILSHSSNEALLRAVEYGRGIRILSQESLECVISFIISQNNNIPRIKKIIEALCLECGKPIEIGEELKKHLSGRSSLCSFPDANAIYSLGEQGLYRLKMGFRAKYVYDAVEKIVGGKLLLDDIRYASSTDEAIERLCHVKGIGVKVASCALLFGFERYDAFPVDVWMKRVGEKYFPEQKELSGKSFGEYAGIAQQYLFYYERYTNI